MRDSDKPMSQREAYQRGYAAGYAAAQSGPPSRKRTVAEIIGDPRTSVTTRPESPAHYVRVCPISDSVCGTPVECGRTPFGCKLDGPLQEGADGPAADPNDLCERLRDNTRNQYGRELDRKEAAVALERLRAERDTLAAIVRAADAMRTVYATDGCECSYCAKAREYDRARAKWEGKP